MHQEPEFLLTIEDFKRKIQKSAKYLCVSPEIEKFISIKLRFYGFQHLGRPNPNGDYSFEYFDADDYYLLYKPEIFASNLASKPLEIIRSFRRDKDDRHFGLNSNFYEGELLPNHTDAIYKFSLSKNEQFLLVQHETGPEIIVVLAVLAASLTLTKEIVSLISQLVQIHSEKYKRRYENIKKQIEIEDIEQGTKKHIIENWGKEFKYANNPKQTKRCVSIESRQFLNAKLVQKVIIKIPIVELPEREMEILELFRGLFDSNDIEINS